MAEKSQPMPVRGERALVLEIKVQAAQSQLPAVRYLQQESMEVQGSADRGILAMAVPLTLPAAWLAQPGMVRPWILVPVRTVLTKVSPSPAAV